MSRLGPTGLSQVFTEIKNWLASKGLAATAKQVRNDPAADSTANLVYSKMATNDFFRIQTGGAANAGYAEIATGDDYNEPIYIRQYQGEFTTLKRTATILDGSGNTSFPGTVTASGFSGKISNDVSGNYVQAVTAGGAVVTQNTTTFGSVWNAPTKSYRVGCGTFPSNNELVYLAYSITNENVTAGTNTVAKQLTWDAGSGTLTANAFSGNASSATRFSANTTVALTGDATGTSAGSKKGWSVPVTLANSGVTAGSYGPSAAASPAHGGTFSVPYVTVDAKGRVTAASTITITLPADSNTDTLMTQNVSTTNATYPVLLCPTANATANQGAKTGIFAKSVKINPSTNVISASGFSGPLTGNVTGNCSGSSGSCTGNAATATKLATARSIALGNEFIGSANFDGSGNITINGSAYLSVIGIGNKNNYPYHCFAKFGPITSQYTDAAIKLLVSRQYINGGSGIIELEFRTNATNGDGQCDVRWIVRSSKIPVDCIQVGFYKTWGGIYADVFYKSSGAYDSCVIRSMGDGSRASYERKFTLQDSSEAANTTASDPLTSVNSYASIAAAGTALHNQAYTNTIIATDSGIVGSANVCTGNANGKELTNTIIKGLSISGKTITYTQIDGNTGTLTTQDTNTDTLMTQNVSTTDATYPILLTATADATANLGAKAGIFGSGVKVNPSTSIISCKGISGSPTAYNSFVNAVKDGGSLVSSLASYFGGVWSAPTKNYRVAAATFPNSGDNVYICYSVTNANVEAGTNQIAKELIWNANSGTLTANSFSGALTGNCSGSSGSCTGNAATATTANESLKVTRHIGEGYVDILQTYQSDNNDYRSCTIRCSNGNGYNTILLGAHDEANSAPKGLSVTNTAGTVTVTSVTPATSDNSTQIATTAFVKAQGYLTSHQSLSNYVTLNGNQTISGKKYFSAAPACKNGGDSQLGATPSSNIANYLEFVDKDGAQSAYIARWHWNNGCSDLFFDVSEKFKNGAKATDGTVQHASFKIGFSPAGVPLAETNGILSTVFLSGDQDPAIKAHMSGTPRSTWNYGVSTIHSGLRNGDNLFNPIGQAYSSGNCAGLVYHHVGNNNSGNYIGIEFFGLGSSFITYRSGLTKTSGKTEYASPANLNDAILNAETTYWGTGTTNKPASSYGTLLTFNREGNVHTSTSNGWLAQLGMGTDARLFLRTKANTGGAWSAWKEFLTSHQSLSNYVTLNGAQTISGNKTFSGTLTGTLTGNCSGTSANVTGTVAIANGGTGATSRLNAVKALTNENVGTAATYFLGITNSWGKAGYISVADARTVLEIPTFAFQKFAWEETITLSSMASSSEWEQITGGFKYTANVSLKAGQLTWIYVYLITSNDLIKVVITNGYILSGKNCVDGGKNSIKADTTTYGSVLTQTVCGSSRLNCLFYPYNSTVTLTMTYTTQAHAGGEDPTLSGKVLIKQ